MDLVVRFLLVALITCIAGVLLCLRIWLLLFALLWIWFCMLVNSVVYGFFLLKCFLLCFIYLCCLCVTLVCFILFLWFTCFCGLAGILRFACGLFLLLYCLQGFGLLLCWVLVLCAFVLLVFACIWFYVL